jgi:RNA polymerase sigma-70 factor (ECF subfamily)
MERMEDLPRLLQKGEPAAFDEFHRRYSGRLLRFVERLCGPRDAEDIAQEVYLRLLRSLPAYREEQRFEAWLFTIANRLCVDAHRRRRPTVQAAAAALAAPARFEPDRAADRRERFEALLAELRRLPFEQRQVFLLREEGGLPFQEIARMLDAPLGTVLARMKYAMDRLRARLAPSTEVKSHVV